MEYITIKEAVFITGKSDKTIRTFIKNTDAKYKKKDGRAYLINKAHLLETYLKKVESSSIESSKSDAKLLEQMQSEITSLREQLNKQVEITKQVIQNMRIEQIKTLSESDKQDIIQQLQNRSAD